MKTKADLIDTTEPALSVDLLEKTSMAVRMLKDAMHLTVVLHNAKFQELEQQHKLEYGE